MLPVMLTPASAQVSGGGTWHVTPFLGAAFQSDATETTTTFGGAVGTAVITHLGLEAEIAVIPDLLTRVGDFKAALLSGHVLYSPLGNAPVLPYGLVGGAFVRLTDEAQVGTATEVAMTLGGGVWVSVSDWISLRTDLRFIHVNNAPNLWRAYGGATFSL